MSHEPKATANALAVIGGIWYIFCVFWVVISKSSYMGIIGSWFHGVDFNALPQVTLTATSAVIGFVSFVGFAWISGYFFAVFYNKFARNN